MNSPQLPPLSRKRKVRTQRRVAEMFNLSPRQAKKVTKNMLKIEKLRNSPRPQP